MSENTSKKNTKVIIIAAIVIIVVLIGAVVTLAIKISSDKDDTSTAEETTATTRQVLINDENAESIVEDLLNEETAVIPVSHYAVDMTVEWHFPDGTSASTDAYVGNSTLNSTDVYFDVARKDNGEIIYASPVIPLGSAIEEIKLDTDLDAGTYPCILTYTLIDENQTPISTLNVAVEIIVEG